MFYLDIVDELLDHSLTGESDEKTAEEANQLNESKAVIKAAWNKACAIEGAEPTSVFVVFSNTNPAAIEHNNLMLAHAKLVNRIKRNMTRRERVEVLKSRPYSQAMRRQQ